MLVIQCHKGYLLCIWAEYFECQYDFLSKKSKTLGRHILFLNIFVKKNNCFTFFMNYFYFSQKRKINIYISQL